MPLPTSIRKRDGRVVLFEPEKISRSLFAATEEIGAPDAFLARELTDGVLHFLSLEIDGDCTTTSHVAELVAKVVREFGHPAIAKLHEECNRQKPPVPRAIPATPSTRTSFDWMLPQADPLTILHQAAREQLRQFSLAHVYPRDLVSAHQNNLLRLLDLEYPGEISGMVLSPSRPLPTNALELLDLFIVARSVAGSFVAIDGPEYALAATDGEPQDLVNRFLTVLERCAQVTGLEVILNLNTAEPPPWAQQQNVGPLFADVSPGVERDRLDRIADLLLHQSRQETVFWHLSERTLSDDSAAKLRDMLAAALDHPNLEFVFDRPRHPIALGRGIDRRQPTSLGNVAINLPQFLEQLGSRTTSAATYVKKLESMTRFAKSAGHARQDYLRKNGRSVLQHGFLLERAVQIVSPIGSVQAAQLLLGDNAAPEEIIELARTSLKTIQATLQSDRPRTMATRLDWPITENTNASYLYDSKIDVPLRSEIHRMVQLGEACEGAFLTISLNQNTVSCVKLLEESIRLVFRHRVARILFKKST